MDFTFFSRLFSGAFGLVFVLIPSLLSLAAGVRWRGFFRFAALFLFVISTWAFYWACLRPGAMASGNLAGLLLIVIHPPVLVLLLLLWIVNSTRNHLDKQAAQSKSPRKTFKYIDAE